MKMYNKVLTAAVSAALAGGMGAANAIINLNNGTGAVTYASEEQVLTGSELANTAVSGFALTATGTIGSNMAVGDVIYIRVNLGTAVFGAGAAAGNMVNANLAFALLQGGLSGDHYAIYSATATAVVDQADTLSFFPGAGGNGTVTVAAQNASDIGMAMYGSQADAANQNLPLTSYTAPYFSWAPSRVVTCDANGVGAGATNSFIDITNPVQFLRANDASDSGPNQVSLLLNPGVIYRLIDGTQVTAAMLYPAGTEVELTGDFGAFQGGDVFFGNIGGAPGGNYGSAVVTPTNAVLTSTVAGALGPFVNTIVRADGSTNIAETTFEVTVTPAAGSLDDSPISLGECGQLVFSGSTDRADMVTAPDGGFTMMVRITNGGGSGGDVFLVVYNDAGESVGPFPLSDVTGQHAAIDAYASTSMIQTQDILDAAQAIDPAFSVSGGMMRIEARGNFNLNTGDNTRNVGQVYIQSYTLSVDGNSFIQNH